MKKEETAARCIAREMNDKTRAAVEAAANVKICSRCGHHYHQLTFAWILGDDKELSLLCPPCVAELKKMGTKMTETRF